MKRISLTYVATYLLAGGVGLALAPAMVLKLFLSNGDYGDVMPRMVGMFMLALAALVAAFVHRGDYSYYGLTVAVRALIVAFMTSLYLMSRDPLFLVLLAIVLVGLVPSIGVLVRERLSR